MKFLKYLGGIVATIVLSLLSSYLFQYPLFSVNPEKVSISAIIAMLVGCGAIVVLIYIAMIFLNKRFKWYSTHEVCIVILISSLVFAVLMVFLFPYIDVPYSWIPAREGAVGYGVVLIQIFTIIPAVVSAIISLVYMIGNKDKQ